jgi:hypothetical protein
VNGGAVAEGTRLGAIFDSLIGIAVAIGMGWTLPISSAFFLIWFTRQRGRRSAGLDDFERIAKI